ncbi:ESX secretion-associated protein EspG [Rhodococcus sp. HNM0569]|uniref:ESX secretion-associated protein EspG n=1 Tax=Rhodococcus sp. HNM0569 TaxID=2716340 RepID=UPI00146BE76D|nr:ESX secretion-associated protein EspG [Rhodococcus sp. HNM0569]NLU84349.1 ESX secretion-associated protein EspG [Rhodococcus sp. HNM0569]
MMRNWLMRGEQFAALWEGAGQDTQPYPFTLVSSASTRDEHEHRQNRIRSAFAGSDRDDVRAAVRILADPEVFVEISGVDVDGSPIRVVGAQLHRWCSVAVQQAGLTADAGGDVVLGAGIAAGLAPLLVGVIPENDAGRITFARRDEDENHFASRSVLDCGWDRAPTPRFEDVMTVACAGRGQIKVFTAPRYRSNEIGLVRWFDAAADGRYMIGPRDPAAAVPASPQLMVDTVTALVEQGLAERRERTEAQWWTESQW